MADRKTRTLDDTTQAPNPGWLRVSPRKLHAMHPELASWHAWLRCVVRERLFRGPSLSYWRAHIQEHMMHGDSRPALVVSVDPLRVAAYTDEMDCVVLLKFDQSFVSDYSLRVGSRLLSVNTYARAESGYATDIIIGEWNNGTWGNYAPYIAEFLSDDVLVIDQLKAGIHEDEWLRTTLAAERYRKTKGLLIARDGRPRFCARAAS